MRLIESYLINLFVDVRYLSGGYDVSTYLWSSTVQPLAISLRYALHQRSLRIVSVGSAL